MTFIVLIGALLLSVAWERLSQVQQDRWFGQLCAWLDRLGLPATLTLVLVILLPVAAAWLALAQLKPLLFGLFWMIAAVFLLLYAFGRGDPGTLFDTYRSHVMPGDFEGAWLMLRQDLAPAESQSGPASPPEVHREALQRLVYLCYQHWFPVVFFFLLLGPAGALAYRLLQLRQAMGNDPGSARLLHAADWVPVRLLALGFLLTGDFLAGKDSLLAAVADPGQPAPELLYEVSQAALQQSALPAEGLPDEAYGPQCGDEVIALRSLVYRSNAAWLVLVSLVIILA